MMKLHKINKLIWFKMMKQIFLVKKYETIVNICWSNW